MFSVFKNSVPTLHRFRELPRYFYSLTSNNYFLILCFENYYEIFRMIEIIFVMTTILLFHNIFTSTIHTYTCDCERIYRFSFFHRQKYSFELARVYFSSFVMYTRRVIRLRLASLNKSPPSLVEQLCGQTSISLNETLNDAPERDQI